MRISYGERFFYTLSCLTLTEDSLQNRFTAYLVTSVKRRKRDYIYGKIRRLYLEGGSIESVASDWNDSEQQSIWRELSLMAQLENEVLTYAMKKLGEKERYIFLAHTLEERSFGDLAAELGMGYKGVAAVYYRAIQRLKSKMKEVEK